MIRSYLVRMQICEGNGHRRKRAMREFTIAAHSAKDAVFQARVAIRGNWTYPRNARARVISVEPI
jgi:hypothetical protein